MKAYEVAALLALAVLIILFFHIAAAKGEKRRLTFINSAGGKVFVDAEIANNSSTMAKGLMGRKSLGENEGMLFVFRDVAVHPFWMLNTTIPLDAIHIDAEGRVVAVLQMEPCRINVFKCRLYYPETPAKYVLEVNQGFAKNHSITPDGSRLILD